MEKPAFDLDAARMIRAMKIATSTPGTRHHLLGVHVEPIDGGGVWLVATDGHTMLIQRDRKGHAAHAATLAITEPAFEPYENYGGDWIASQEWTGHRLHVPYLKQDETTAAPTFFGGTGNRHAGDHVLITRIDGTYPDWRAAIQRPPKGIGPYEVTPHRVGQSVRSITALTAGHTSFRLHGDRDKMEAFFVTFDGDPDALGIFMPSRLSKDTPQPDDIMSEILRTAPKGGDSTK